MVVLTIVWTELRHLFYVPSWFRFSNGIVAVILIGFSITPLRRLLISDRLYGLYRKALPRVSKTEQEALDIGFGFVKGIGKLPLECMSSPGFVVNRILAPYMAEAMELATVPSILPLILASSSMK